MPDYRETIVRIDHTEQAVYIWTQEAAILRKLDKAAAPLEQRERGPEWRRVPLARFRWKVLGIKRPVQLTEAQLEHLARMREHAKAKEVQGGA